MKGGGGGGGGGGCRFISHLGNCMVPEVAEEPQGINFAIIAKFMPAPTSILQNNNKI